jgi:hypothetical protein
VSNNNAPGHQTFTEKLSTTAQVARLYSGARESGQDEISPGSAPKTSPHARHIDYAKAPTPTFSGFGILDRL